jgi:hypothetical protein
LQTVVTSHPALSHVALGVTAVVSRVKATAS